MPGLDIYNYNSLLDPEVHRILNSVPPTELTPRELNPAQPDNKLAQNDYIKKVMDQSKTNGAVPFLSGPPVYDQGKENRLKNAAKINVLGKTLATLGEAAGLSNNATINKRQPDNMVSNLYSMIEQNKSKFQSDKKNYEYQKSAGELRRIQLGMDQAKIDTANANSKYDHAYKDKALGLTEDNNNITQRISAYNAETNRMRAESDASYKKTTAANAKDKASKTKQFLPWKDPRTGITTDIGEDNFRNLYEQATKTATPDDLKAYLAQFDNNPTEAKKQIVVEYLNKLSAQQGANGAFGHSDSPNTPIGALPQPIAQPRWNPDVSKTPVVDTAKNDSVTNPFDFPYEH